MLAFASHAFPGSHLRTSTDWDWLNPSPLFLLLDPLHSHRVLAGGILPLCPKGLGQPAPWGLLVRYAFSFTLASAMPIRAAALLTAVLSRTWITSGAG
jgi:hypothetical protein